MRRGVWGAVSTWGAALAAACLVVTSCYASHERGGTAAVDAGRDARADAGRDAGEPSDGGVCDRDGDGARSIACGGDDCDDSDASTYPGATELCNGRDDDCSGTADETFECMPGVEQACMTPCGTAGSRICGTDCGFSACRLPPEICDNGVDDDCDGSTDERFAHAGTDLSFLGSEFRYQVASPDIAWTGDAHVVTWLVVGPSAAYGNIVYAARVSSGLDAASTPLIVVRRHPGFLAESAIVAGQSPPLIVYAAATMTGRQVLGAWLTADGSAVARESALAETDGETRTPAGVAVGGGDVMMVWRNGAQALVRRFAGDGTAVGGAIGFGVSSPEAGLSIVDVESGWVVGWLGDDEVARVALVGPAADRIDAVAELSERGVSAGPPALAWTGRQIAAVWTDRDGSVVTARADRALSSVSVPVRVGMALDRLIRPAIAWTGGRVVLAWRAPEGVQIMALPERPGEMPNVIDVTSGTGTEPRLVWTGTNVTLAWVDGSSVTDPALPAEVHLARYVGVCP